MTIEEAYAEMKRHGWQFARMGGLICIGPEIDGIVEVYGADNDPIKALEKAIKNEVNQ